MKRAAVFGMILLALSSLQARAQSTAFTYQGELKQGGQLANGVYDMRFRMYDALTGGSQPGPTACVDNVSVASGRFTTTIDVGAQHLSTADRYLEIEVRADTGQGCANTTGYTILSPRQKITPAPRATAATTANSLAIPNGSSVLVNLTNTGNVGIGTNAPTSQLHLNGVQDALRISATGPKIDLFDTSSANARFQLQNSQGRLFMTSESFINGTNTGGFAMVDPQGRLGLGVFDPAGALDVGGRIQLRGPSGVFNSAGVYLSSPLSSPVVRAFVGLLDDTHVGFFGATSGWTFTMDTISGNVNIGPAGRYFVPASEENLRIVRGTVNPGGLQDGLGWTALTGPVGTTTVRLTVPMAGIPTAVATTIGPAGRTAQVTVLSTTVIEVNTQLSGQPFNVPFNFIAVGPR